MSCDKIKVPRSSFVTISYILMVIVNGLATTLPINGISTGAVSEKYPNLFTPAGLTFSIWGLIYLLLGGYTVYQLGFYKKDRKTGRIALLEKIGIIFGVSSLANIAWIFSWHYDLIPVSMVIMIVILICLVLINNETKKRKFKAFEKLFIRLPFSVYFGWITIATIANTTVLLVSLGWKGFGIPEETWAVMVLVLGMVIASIVMVRNRDVAYGLVVIWAYSGIWIKHTSAEAFARGYPTIINTVLICIALMVVAEGYIFFVKDRER